MGFSSTSKNWSDEELKQARLQMVERQLVGRDVTDIQVLEAMRKIPRHLFVPPEFIDDAYDDTPLPIGHEQTISQPYVVGSMTQYLEPSKRKTVLEIGTGSGYQTAVLAELFSSVHTVEIIGDLSMKAQEILTQLGYDNISFHIGNGLTVPSTPQSFDSIIVTAAPEDIPAALINRLAANGRMIIPVGSYSQYLKLVFKDDQGRLSFESLYPVRFVPLQSSH